MLLGSLGPIPRARVTDLVQVDPDVPMAPNHRANTLVGTTVLISFNDSMWISSVNSVNLSIFGCYFIIPFICQLQQGATTWGQRVWSYFEAMPFWGYSAGGGECECLWFDSQSLLRVVPSRLEHAIGSLKKPKPKSHTFHLHWLLHRWCWTKEPRVCTTWPCYVGLVFAKLVLCVWFVGYCLGFCETPKVINTSWYFSLLLVLNTISIYHCVYIIKPYPLQGVVGQL